MMGAKEPTKLVVEPVSSTPAEPRNGETWHSIIDDEFKIWWNGEIIPIKRAVACYLACKNLKEASRYTDADDMLDELYRLRALSRNDAGSSRED